ncbi:MAG: PQQ-binding-like beta-propeller repeat protein, partial [Planctomycetota bacterium]
NPGNVDNQIALIAGGEKIRGYNALSGQLGFELQVDPGEQINYLAVSKVLDDGSEILVATTSSGRVYAWHGVDEESEQQWQVTDRSDGRDRLANAECVKVASTLDDDLLSSNGWLLLLGDRSGGMAEAILETTNLRILSLVATRNDATAQREYFQAIGQYGHRVSVWDQAAWNPSLISPGIFNALIEVEPTEIAHHDLIRAVAPGYGMIRRAGEESFTVAPPLEGAGSWRHQYANPRNSADTGDQYIGNAAGFQLSWFGGVGPGRMPDRHLRGPAPLVAGPTMIMQGDGVLIGVDPANGTERWQLELPPGTMRYVTPFDAGYASLSEDGTLLCVATSEGIWNVDALNGEVLGNIESQKDGLGWGYVASSGDELFATLLKSTAPRTSQDREVQYQYVNDDYKSARPLVTSRTLVKLAADASVAWEHSAAGVIVNGTIAIDDRRVIFVEARSDTCANHHTDRIPLPMLMEDAFIVCLSKVTGDVVWEQPFVLEGAQNVLYVQLSGDKLVLSTSQSDIENEKAFYFLRVISLTDGSTIHEWSHEHVRSGLFHGEQNHHPVVLSRPDESQLVVAEPFLYDLQSGERLAPGVEDEGWALQRPGHSCGTISAAGNCLFFRAGNPTVLNLSSGEFTALAPTRPGCWINMIPAGGRLLIPEGSASCVCKYSLQTSMGFLPVSREDLESALPVLADVIPGR